MGRYAVKRLRRKFPDALIMVGAWHMDVDERINTLKQTVAADFFVTTVTEAAQVALAAAKAKPPEAKLEAQPGDMGSAEPTTPDTSPKVREQA